MIQYPDLQGYCGMCSQGKGNMTRLYERLNQYKKEDIYPFHMPGHKRNLSVCGTDLPADMDITEITGFDNLHDPCGLLSDARQAAAQLYGVKEAWYSVNGSTAAILASVSACVPDSGRILIARNCHKSVYNAVSLRRLDCGYVCPGNYDRCALCGGIRPGDVKAELERRPDTRAVVITSPTYDGIASDIRGIADVVHASGAVLIVDAAHGAHFAFHGIFPEPAEKLGADLVIVSIHKTLPSLTQTALLLRCSDRVDGEKIQKFLSFYQSSSPSYVLMGGMDACIAKLERDGKKIFRQYAENLLCFRKSLTECRCLQLLEPGRDPSEGIQAFDPSKILISTENSSLDGPALHRILHDRFRIECEMEGPEYVLALSSVGDTQEGFIRLKEAILTLDREESGKEHFKKKSRKKMPDPVPETVFRIADAEEASQESRLLADSIGKISGEYAFVYPPGIPLIVPGERITETFADLIREYRERGLNLKGFHDREFKTIRIVQETKTENG